MPITLILQDPQATPWTSRINQTLLRSRLTSLFDASGCPEGAEATLVLTDDREVHDLNREWRGVDKPTDVLAFAMQEGELDPHAGHLLGDVVISLDTADRQARDLEHQRRLSDEGTWDLTDEISFLAVHGVLHLLGYDHAEPEEEAEMRAEEQRIWRLIRAADPTPPA